MKLSRSLPLLVAPSLAACALVANLGERTLATTDDEAGKPAPARDAAVVAPPREGGGPPAPLPPFCNGITLYASFDAQLAGDVGGETTQTTGGVTRSPAGKFGGALSLVRTPDKPAEGAALYFTASAKGNPWPQAQGSLSVWYKRAPDAAPEVPVLYRPVGSLPPAPLKAVGLTLYLRNDIDDVFGLHQRAGGNAGGGDQVLTFPVDAVKPFLKDGDYNHVFSAWREGAAPTAYLAINGGLGVAFEDPGDVVYPDAGTNGELRVPYRGFTSQRWQPGGAAVGLRLGGPGNNSPDGLLDDLVVWNRVLGFDEVAALYLAGSAVGAACRLVP